MVGWGYSLRRTPDRPLILHTDRPPAGRRERPMTAGHDQRAISRRGFLRTLGLVASVGLIQACAPAAPSPGTSSAPKPAETKPAAASKPTEGPKPAAPAAAPPTPPSSGQ